MFFKPLCTFLETVIKGEDKIQYIRALEFLIKLSLKSEQLGKLLGDLLSLVLALFGSSDVLTKLNVVELVPALVDKPWTSAILARSKFVESLLTTESVFRYTDSRVG